MGESLAVYSFLAFIMMFCGGVMARRYPAVRGVSRNVIKKRNGNKEVEYVTSYQTKDTFSNLEIWVPILVFAIIFGCRWCVGVDYPHYLALYNGTDKRNLEALFALLTNGYSYLGFHYALYFITIAFIEIFLIYYAFRKYKYIYPFLAFFLIVGFWYMSLMNIMRQQLAACMFLVSIQYILERKPLKYYLCVLIAFLFHKSAILLVVIYPLFKWKKDWFKNIYVQLGLFAFALIIAKFDLANKFIEVPFLFFTQHFGYSNYTAGILTNETLNDKTQFGRNTGFGIYAQILKFLPIILYSNKMKKYFNDTFFTVAYSIWFVGLLASISFTKSIVLNRPFIFATNFLHIIPAFFFYYCIKRKKLDTTLWLALLIFIYLLLFINLISNGAVNTSAFTFFWQH